MTQIKATPNYAHFILKRWQSLKPGMQEAYGGFEKFARYYTASRGFSEWLNSLHGTSLTEWQTQDVATAYAKHARRQPHEIPAILASLHRQYNIDLPVVEGILTAQYWVDLAQRENWQAFYFPETNAA